MRSDELSSLSTCQLVIITAPSHSTYSKVQYRTGYYYILSFLCNPLTGRPTDRPTTVIKYHRHFITIAVFFFFAFSTAQHNTTQQSTTQHNTTQHNTTLGYAVL